MSVLQYFQSEIVGQKGPMDIRSIAYVNIENRLCKVIRYIEVEKNSRNLTFYRLSEPIIPLERALTVNTKLDNFLLYLENEDEMRQVFKQKIIEKKNLAEMEKTQIEETRQK